MGFSQKMAKNPSANNLAIRIIINSTLFLAMKKTLYIGTWLYVDTYRAGL